MTSKFVKVKCEKCKNEQMVFERAASKVKCLVCGEILAEPTGGRVRLNVKLAPEKAAKEKEGDNSHLHSSSEKEADKTSSKQETEQEAE